MHYPVSLIATCAEHAQARCRPLHHYQASPADEWVLLVELEAGGTAYRAEQPMGRGPSAAVAATMKAASLKRGTRVMVHADRQTIVTGRRQRIELLGVQQLEPLAGRGERLSDRAIEPAHHRE